MWLLQIRNYNIAIIIININYMGKNVKMICDPQCFRTHTTNNTPAYVFGAYTHTLYAGCDFYAEKWWTDDRTFY